MIINALQQGEAALQHITVSAGPCGHCRQFMNELACVDTIRITFQGGTYSMQQLLPFSFSLSHSTALMQKQNHPVRLSSSWLEGRAALRGRYAEAAEAAVKQAVEVRRQGFCLRLGGLGCRTTERV